MKRKETIREFYTNHGQEYPKTGQFNIYRREEFACDSISLPFNRRDFYKISLITKGTGIISYADKSIKIDKPSITFLNQSLIRDNRLLKAKQFFSVFLLKTL